MIKSDRMLRCDAMRCNDQILYSIHVQNSHHQYKIVETRVPTFQIQQYRLIQLLKKESRKHQRMMMKSDRMLRCDAMRCNDQM